MRIYPEQLAANLQRGLNQNYLLFGNEPLLKQESIQNIVEQAKQQGFDEIHRFTIEAQFNWQYVYDCCQSLSLFSSRQILILSIPESGFNIMLTNNLKILAPLLHADILLILNGPRLNQKQESSQWFTCFKQHGIYVPCNAPDSKQITNFIKMRCDRLGLKPDNEAIQLMALWHEGNLLALAQSLLKLQLLYSDGNLTLTRVQEALSPHHHFTPFQLIDALLEGKAKRAMRILRQQEREGVEITLLLRLVQKELILLYKMQELRRTGMELKKIFDQFNIWLQKRSMYTNALNCLSLPLLTHLLNCLSKLEIIVKTSNNNQFWLQFTEFCLNMCNIPTAKAQ